MSKLHAIEFLQRIGRDEVSRDVAATAEAWTAEAASAGLSFTTQELRAVIEQIVERPLKVEECVSALLDATTELDNASLDLVTGGVAASRAVTVFSPNMMLRLAGIRGPGGSEDPGDPTFCNAPDPPKSGESVY